MHRLIGFSAFGVTMLCAAGAVADPVIFHPDGCDFELSFPAAPSATQIKTTTDRSDIVVTDRASLRDGANYLRAECTKIPHMGFVDEAVLTENMYDLAKSYNVQNAIISVQHNKLTGAVGRIHGSAQLGGKTLTLEIYRYTSAANILDVWVGSAPEAFPSDADTAFLKSLKLNGTASQ